MGKKKRLIGDRFLFIASSKRPFVMLYEISKMQEQILKGEKIYTICKNFNISYGMYRVLNQAGYFAFCRDKQKPVSSRNSFIKKENDITEEEMIQGIPNYIWKDLPRNEKEFYYKYNHEMKSDWTQEEIKTVENYYHASDHELKSDTWLYVKEMIDQSGLNFPKRTPSAYRSKMQKVWRNRKELEKFQVN